MVRLRRDTNNIHGPHADFGTSGAGPVGGREGLSGAPAHTFADRDARRIMAFLVAFV
jgi:hypothetical protein